MKALNITNGASRLFYRGMFQLKKHSPEILIVTGVVGAVASAVLACKATLKANEIVKETKQDVMMIHDCQGDMELQESGKYTDEDARKDLTIVYTRTAVRIAKTYAPAVILGALSITAILTSNNILRKRNVALMAAYATLDSGFKDYRKRVVERYGEQIDFELANGIKAKTIETEVVNEETGEVEKKEEVVDEVSSKLGLSPYARIFDDGSRGWVKDASYNKMFLRFAQNQANDKLILQGYLTLNEVYEMLGFDKTAAGQVVGWVYDPKHPEREGDGYVDFGLNKLRNKLFMDGQERVAILDFNVDGVVYDKMPIMI